MPTEFTVHGTVKVNFAGIYTVWIHGEERSAEITIGSTAYIDQEGALVLQGVSVLYHRELQNMDLSVYALDDPSHGVATK